MYKEEYSDCTSIKSRFNQYFIYGEIIDCSQWKKDFKNCKKWSNKKDDTAYVSFFFWNKIFKQKVII